MHIVVKRKKKRKARFFACRTSSSFSTHSLHTSKIGRDHPRQEGNKEKRIKRTKDFKEIQEIEGHEENKNKNKEKGKNNILHDIRKSLQPHIFSGGVNIEPEAILSFLGMVENLSEGELSKKEKVKAIPFLLKK